MNRLLPLMSARVINHGLPHQFLDDAMAYVIEHEDLSNIRNRWMDDISAYDDMFIATIWMLIKSIVYEWIGLNHPNAWFRRSFDTKTNGE